MFENGCSHLGRFSTLKHSLSKLEKKNPHAIACLKSRLTQSAESIAFGREGLVGAVETRERELSSPFGNILAQSMPEDLALIGKCTNRLQTPLWLWIKFEDQELLALENQVPVLFSFSLMGYFFSLNEIVLAAAFGVRSVSRFWFVIFRYTASTKGGEHDFAPGKERSSAG